MTKRIISFLLLVILSFGILVGCTKTESYKDDVACDFLVSELGKYIAKFDEMSQGNDVYFKYKLMADQTKVDDWSIKLMSNGVELDEIVIIKAKTTDDTKSIEETIKDYLSRRNEEWTGLYGQEDYPKLRDAEYKTFGKYTICLLLSESEKKTVFSKAKELLLK